MKSSSSSISPFRPPENVVSAPMSEPANIKPTPGAPCGARGCFYWSLWATSESYMLIGRPRMGAGDALHPPLPPTKALLPSYTLLQALPSLLSWSWCYIHYYTLSLDYTWRAYVIVSKPVCYIHHLLQYVSHFI